MEKSESIKGLATALVKAQKEIDNAIKGSKNPFFKSNYADLNSIREACLPVLNAHGISVIQPIVQVEGKSYVQTMLLHESGEYISGLTEILYSKQNDAQAQGSGITYARRYGMQSLVNVGAEDDDGNAASGNNSNGKSKSSYKAPAANPKDKPIDSVLKEINAVKSQEEGKTVWNKYPQLQKEQWFKDAAMAKGESFKKQATNQSRVASATSEVKF